MTTKSWLVYLSDEECATLLRSTPLGRLAVIVDCHPEIYPVNHVVDDKGGLAFPTTAGTKLHAALEWPSVAFEVDGTEPDGSEGWSVLVVGRAEEITDPEEVARMTRERHVLWAPGDAARWIRVVASKITGRRIGASRSTS
jgi:nitroimidazol reductase NimA-like FMN-containing flavoprotein (pyridoxamine 5'-phosphate oxidase superfamily)